MKSVVTARNVFVECSHRDEINYRSPWLCYSKTCQMLSDDSIHPLNNGISFVVIGGNRYKLDVQPGAKLVKRSLIELLVSANDFWVTVAVFIASVFQLCFPLATIQKVFS